VALISAPPLGIANIEWTLDRPAQINIDLVNKRTVGTPLYGKWFASVDLAPIVGENNFRQVRSFLFRCNGVANSFHLAASCAAQNANSGVTLSAGASAGDTSVTISGAATALLDGQLVTINNQLLQLTEDQSGSTITFEPPLRAAVSAGASVETANPYALVRMASGAIAYEISVGHRFDCSFAVEEVVSA
jgi:hypothetical protein